MTQSIKSSTLKNILKSLSTLFVASVLSTGAMAQNKNLDLDALLKQLEEGQFHQNAQNKEREAEFRAKVAEQDRMIREATQTRTNEEARSERLETSFEENEFKIADLQGALDKRLGSL